MSLQDEVRKSGHLKLDQFAITGIFLLVQGHSALAGQCQGSDTFLSPSHTSAYFHAIKRKLSTFPGLSACGKCFHPHFNFEFEVKQCKRQTARPLVCQAISMWKTKSCPCRNNQLTLQVSAALGCLLLWFVSCFSVFKPVTIPHKRRLSQLVMAYCRDSPC